MEDVLALYERPYDPREPVVCLDEKPNVAKRDNEYRRCGTANIFGIVEPKAGRHLTLVAAYPKARTIHLVLDNVNIHYEGSLVAVFGPRRVGAWTGRANRRAVRIHWRFARKKARAKFHYNPNTFKRSKT